MTMAKTIISKQSCTTLLPVPFLCNCGPCIAQLLWQPSLQITGNLLLRCTHGKTHSFFMASCSSSTWNIYFSSKIGTIYSSTLRFRDSFCDWNSNSPSNESNKLQMIRLFWKKKKGGRRNSSWWSYIVNLHNLLSDWNRLNLQVPNCWETMWKDFQKSFDIFVSIPQGTDHCWNSLAAFCLIYRVERGPLLCRLLLC